MYFFLQLLLVSVAAPVLKVNDDILATIFTISIPFLLTAVRKREYYRARVFLNIIGTFLNFGRIFLRRILFAWVITGIVFNSMKISFIHLQEVYCSGDISHLLIFFLYKGYLSSAWNELHDFNEFVHFNGEHLTVKSSTKSVPHLWYRISPYHFNLFPMLLIPEASFHYTCQ